MALSQNGYSVISRSDCKFYDVGPLELPLRDDACGLVLAHFLTEFHKRVEPLGKTETFGHSERKIAGSDDWSNHASGTAVDANSAQHPYGKVNTFTRFELAELERLLSEYDDVIKWGGNYRNTKDEMHFEIDKEYSEVRKLAQVLRRDNTVNLSRVRPGKRNINVYMVKRALNKRGFYDGSMSNYFGSGLRNAYRKWQESLGYTGADADGVPGRASLEALGLNIK